MSDICLCVLIGIPASGKTTLSKMITSKQYDFSVIHFCYDNFSNCDNAGIVKELPKYKDYRRSIFSILQNLITDLKHRKQINSRFKLHQGRNSNQYLIIIDDTMHYRSMRYEIIRLARQQNLGYFQIFMESDLFTAIENNNKRPNAISNDDIKSLFLRLEEPNVANKWERISIKLNKNYMGFFCNEQLNDIVLQCFKEPENCKQLTNCSPQIIEHSIIHKIDLILRREIKTIIINLMSTGINIKCCGYELNNKRKKILNDLKSNIIEIPEDIENVKFFLK